MSQNLSSAAVVIGALRVKVDFMGELFSIIPEFSISEADFPFNWLHVLAW